MPYRGTPTRGICERRPQVDVRRLYKDGLLDPQSHMYGRKVPSIQSTDPDQITVRCDYDGVTLWHGDREEEAGRLIKIVTTKCDFGGKRPWFERSWFQCPSCRQRCAILYFGGGWSCRTCFRLKYQSQANPRNAWTGYEKIKSIRERLEAYPTSSIWEPMPPRPKWMRLARYEKLKAEYEAAQRRQCRTVLLDNKRAGIGDGMGIDGERGRRNVHGRALLNVKSTRGIDL